MKIIAKGRPQKGWATEEICTGTGNGGGGCKATLLVEQDDLYETIHNCHDGSAESFVTFTCAECGVETDLKETVLIGVAFRDELPSKTQWKKSRVDSKEVAQFIGAEVGRQVSEPDHECG